MSALLQSPAVLIRSVMQYYGNASFPQDNLAWPAYISAMPDGNTVMDECIALYDMEGMKEGREMNTGNVFERYRVQVKVRSRDYQTGWERLANIIQTLDAVNCLGLDAIEYIYYLPVVSRGLPVSLGPEPGMKRRFYFTVNLNFPCKEFGPKLNLGVDFYTQVGNLHTLINVSLPPLIKFVP